MTEQLISRRLLDQLAPKTSIIVRVCISREWTTYQGAKPEQGRSGLRLSPAMDVGQVRIITLDGTDIGWLQSFAKDDALFLGQLFVDGALRRQGIGTEVVKGLIEEAARAGRAVTLGVVKTNPALRLYERLGFRTTHEDARKFYMRRD